MVNNMSRIRDYSLSGEERKTRLRVCIFDAAGVKSAFALLLTKVTKPSLGNLLICAVSGTSTDKDVYKRQDPEHAGNTKSDC